MNPYTWLLFGAVALFVCSFMYVFPQLIIVVIIAFAIAAALNPSVKTSRVSHSYNTARGWVGLEPVEARGLVVTTWLLASIIIIGIIAWVFVPQVIGGVNSVMSDIPARVEALQQSLQTLLTDMETLGKDLFPGFDFTGYIAHTKEKIPEFMGSSLRVVFEYLGSGVMKGTFGVGLIFFTIILSAFIIVEHEFISKGFAVASRQISFGRHEQNVELVRMFQANVRGFFRGIGKNMIIFAIAYTALFLFAGIEWYRAIMFGIVIGAFASIPKVGGFIVNILLVPICLLYFGITTKSVVVYLTSMLIHFIEVNFITPKMIGSEVKLPSFLIFTAILGGATLFGAIAGVLIGIFALCFGKALWDVGFKKEVVETAQQETSGA